ncbi:DEDD exnuclease domain-containing protein [Serinibacter arcticus]|uniref:DEDD exnuclease domain-containing protein n=1 Tax=Serinibacter arcticus TaxID=1655435 RepID=A0A2U1ZSC2_9MICO|nr:DEDD exonuclease domain-containing protein [Serinibacter arcticus]PWD49850.1 DEDD exnuclease domain-containing protein [Serinibacter arcticus]
MTSTLALQPSLLADGLPLHAVEFVVVDLETTGGSPNADRITEIGAVRVRGGEVLGELGTLVNPGRAIPPQITVLTGITDTMVVDAPREEEVLVTFMEFARDAVLVAHNARFDIGFLRAGCERMGLTWPSPVVVDTVALARRVVTKDEAPNHKLGSLARLFHASVTPDHRALTDARATVDVLHGLLARLAPLGVGHLDDLVTASDPVPEARRRKATLADHLPTAPGVYQFLDGAGRILYVGTATNLRTRVRSYFTAAEKRKRIAEMVTIAERVHPIVCSTPLEASIREIRLIAQHRPPYNRRSRSPAAEPWIRITDEAYPRPSIVRSVPLAQTAGVLGPFRSRSQATLALEAIQGAFALRGCTDRLPARPAPGATACALADLGRCAAPCTGGTDVATYASLVAELAAFCDGDTGAFLERTARRIGVLSAQERYEEAARERDRCQALLRGAQRTQRLRVSRPAQVVAARPGSGGWEVVVARHGRLAASAVAARASEVLPLVDAMLATAEDVPAPSTWSGATLVEETELISHWLEQPGVRIISLTQDEGPSRPVRGADHALSDLSARLAAPTPEGPSPVDLGMPTVGRGAA